MKRWLALLLLVSKLASAQHEKHAEAPHESSGRSWQPASTPMEAIPLRAGAWSFMLHGFWNGVYQDESGPRGRAELFSTNMAMLEVGRSIGAGRLVLRGMLSLEPTLGPEGYPLLLQTGESADGRNPLFDRQHPHDLFMEISVSYARPLGRRDHLFVYFAPVGEPALGPSAFVHRASTSDNPIAPLSHHWLDGAYITYGVLSFGFRRDERFKLDSTSRSSTALSRTPTGGTSTRFDSILCPRGSPGTRRPTGRRR